MSTTASVAGRWLGHYLQRGLERPITAELRQIGELLSGTMCDGHQDEECSLFEMAQGAGFPPGADEQIEKQVREALPDAPPGPIRFVAHLPADSILKGRCKASGVYFLKTYQGTSYSGYKAGDQLLGAQTDGHAVHYEGRLSTDGQVIEGRWWIDADPEAFTLRTEGHFVLRRQPISDRD